MIHQPLGGAQGQETDLEIQVKLSRTIYLLVNDRDIILINEDIFPNMLKRLFIFSLILPDCIFLVKLTNANNFTSQVTLFQQMSNRNNCYLHHKKCLIL
jgi:hypothetical protein